MSKEIASEKMHWYKQDGSPCYEIESAKGSMRPTTLRDARKLSLLPSVTTIMSVFPKPGLIAWKEKQILMAALTATRLVNETDDTYMARIMSDAKEQAKRAAEKGTAIHGQIERYLSGEEADPEFIPTLTAVSVALKDFFGEHIAPKCEVEKSFASTLGYGGKVDLHSKALNFVCDFKTKEFDADTKQLAWDEQQMQLQAYRHGLGMPTARMINVFISTSVPGLVRIVEHDKDNNKYMDVFKACLTFWQEIKGYKVGGDNGR